ncbi:MAG: type II toxin-antitoxin system HicB family antitoxin [Acidobacteria bacterium]|nr:type II toxin-antitoxin system HicB family antitoxin [Acidobacteriota bacterium]MBI3656554.1 type II toxin-antitoxin system HicB family antitoxin [Acidobacteriota bacterium]
MKNIKQKINQYTAIFDPDKDGGYTVTVPALPGLVPEGNTLKEARYMAADAIQCYLESPAKDLAKTRIDAPNYKQGNLTVGKIVITPYQAQIFGPVGISDSELFIKLWLIKQRLDVLFDETRSKASRIESLKNLLTVCDKHLCSLIEKEIASLSKPKKLEKINYNSDLSPPAPASP